MNTMVRSDTGARGRSLRFKPVFGAAFVALALAAAPISTEAQQRRGGAPSQVEQSGQRAEMMHRVQAQINGLMKESLGLTDEQIAEIDRISAEFRIERGRLFREERELKGSLGEGGRTFRRNWIIPELTDERALEVLERQQDIREREAALFLNEQDALLEVVSPSQLLGIYQIRSQINERIRGLQDGPGERGGGPGSGGGVLLPH